MLKRAVLTFLMLFSFSFLTLRGASSFFVSTAVSSNNTFSTAEEFPSVTPTTTISPTPTGEVDISPNPSGSTTIVINEVNPNGGNDDDWIEIHNKSVDPIDISGWLISDNDSTETIPLSTIIPGNTYGVLVSNESSVIVPGSAIAIVLNTAAIGNGLSPAGERILIENESGTDIDQMSYGNNTSVFTMPAITSTPIYARNPNGIDTDLATDWVLQTATIGVSNNTP